MWLDLSKDEDYLSKEEWGQLNGQFNRIGAMFESLWKKWRACTR